MADKKNFWLKICLGAGWLVFVCWYFGQHFPFVHLREILLNGAMLLILLLFFVTVGKRVFRFFRISFASLTEECCFAFGIGSGVMILLMFGLAVVGLLYEILIMGLVLGLFLLLYKDARTICLQGYHAFAGIAFSEIPGAVLVLLVLMGVAGSATFIAAATPPFFYDALVYHLAVPHQYLLHHGFQYLPHQHFSNFPANLGMLFIIAMSFSGGLLAQLLSWSFAPLTALAVYAFGQRLWGKHTALTAAAITFLVPGLLLASTLAAVDLGVMFYSLLAFAAGVFWVKFRRKHWLVLSSIFCSLAIGTKYTAIVTTFLPVLIFLFLHVIHECFGKRDTWLGGCKKMLLFGTIVGCGVAPWLIKNSVYTGNPMYPFFNAVFGAHGSPLIEYGQYLSQDHSLFTKGQPWFDVLWTALKAPWTVTMTTNGAAGKTGLIFLLCLPGLLLLKKIDGSAKCLLALAGCAFWLWVFLLPRTLRYVFPMFPPLSLVTGYLLWRIPCSRRGRKVILGGISILLCYHLLIFFAEELFILRPFTYLFGNQAQEAFLLDHGVEYYPVMQYLNQEIPENARILFVGESRGYYCERDYLLYTVITGIDDNELILRNLIVASQTAAEVIQKLQQMRITHLLFNRAEMMRFTRQYLTRDSYFGFETEKDREIYRSLFSPQYLRLLISQYQVDLYEILPTSEKP